MASVQAPATAATSASHPYTCNTCQVAYRNIDLQKTHMKSDWQLVLKPYQLNLRNANTFSQAVTI